MSDSTHPVVEAANRWMQAWVQRDSAVLDEMLAPDFALIVSATPDVRLDRSAWLETACTRYVASEFSYTHVQVRELAAGLAVMSSIAEFTAEIDGMPRTGPLFVVDVWRRCEGRWRVCSRYSSSPEPGGSAASAISELRTAPTAP